MFLLKQGTGHMRNYEVEAISQNGDGTSIYAFYIHGKEICRGPQGDVYAKALGTLMAKCEIYEAKMDAAGIEYK